MTQYSLGDLKEFQRQDADLEPLIRWLEADVSPTEADLMLQSSSTKHMWLYREHLKLRQGILFYKWDHGLWKTLLLVIPGSLKDKVIQLFHDTMSGGHLGHEKTMEKIKQRAYWYGMSTDVSLYVATCRQRTVNKRSPRTLRAPLQNYQAGHPGERVHLDMLGPFCESLQGNKYVLMIIDQFLYQCKMRNLLPRHFSSITSFVLKCIGVSIQIKGGTLIASCSRLSVNCSKLWRHWLLLFDPVRMDR